MPALTLPLIVHALTPLKALGDRRAMAQSVADLLQAAGVRECGIHLVEGNSIIRVTNRAPEAGIAPAAERLVAQVIETGRPGVTGAESGTQVTAVLPLKVHRHTLGTLTVVMDQSHGPVTEADLALLGEVAAALAVAFSDAEILNRAAQISQTLQQSLLPAALPSAEWFRMAGRYVPGTAGLDVGGDWYDAQILDDGTLALSVGDVAGHGVEAAARMGELRSATTALRLVRRGPDDLIAVLHRLSASIGYFATAICARLDRHGNLVWASAGHLPPVLISSSGEGQLLASDQSPPLGIGYPGQVPTNRWRLGPGDTVLLFTDGLIERRREGIDVSLKRLVGHVSNVGWPVPADLIEGVLALRGHPEATGDDTAVLAARLRNG